MPASLPAALAKANKSAQRTLRSGDQKAVSDENHRRDATEAVAEVFIFNSQQPSNELLV